MLYPRGSGQTQELKRAGELLAETDSARGANLPNVGREGGRPIAKAKAARAAGSSDYQRKTPHP